jgi:hypothetical protein
VFTPYIKDASTQHVANPSYDRLRSDGLPVLTAAIMKMAAFRLGAPLSLVDVYRLFRWICWLHLHGDLPGKKHFCAVDKRLQDCTARQARIQPSSRIFDHRPFLPSFSTYQFSDYTSYVIALNTTHAGIKCRNKLHVCEWFHIYREYSPIIITEVSFVCSVS